MYDRRHRKLNVDLGVFFMAYQRVCAAAKSQREIKLNARLKWHKIQIV